MTIEQKKARKKEIRSILADTSKALTSEELAALDTELRQLNADIEALERRASLLGSLPNEDPTPKPESNPQKRGGGGDEEDPRSTKEYRKAFMKFVQTGELAPEYRADASTALSDVSAVIPSTILNEMISKMKQYGHIFSRVRKLNIKGGVNVPIVSLKPVATWMTGNTPTDRQKLEANTQIQFSYYGLECRVAIDLLASAVSLDMFEDSFSSLIAEAMIHALEKAIFNGTGTGEPHGITVDPRIPAAQVITLSAADFTKWDGWKKKVFAKIPLAYRAGGEFFMAAGTFEGYIEGMVDSAGQPVGRVNYGITSGPQERFGGKPVVLVEDDIVAPYEAAVAGDVVAVFAKLSDYAINSNLSMQTFKWFDHDTNQYVNKSVLICDGKILDPNGVLVIKKGA